MKIGKKLTKFLGLEKVQDSFTTCEDSLDNSGIKTNYSYEISDKIEQIIKKNYINMNRGSSNGFNEFKSTKDIRNFIEKMASWYELLWPEYEICKLMPCSGIYEISINDVMFESVANQICIDNELRELFDWTKIYGFATFYKALPSDEKWYISKPKYRTLIYLGLYTHLHLDQNGIVIESENLGELKFKESKNHNNLTGLPNFEYLDVKDAKKYIKRAGLNIEDLKELTTLAYDCVKKLALENNWTESELNHYLNYHRTVKSKLEILKDAGIDIRKINELEFAMVCYSDQLNNLGYNKIRATFFNDSQFNGMYINDVYDILKKVGVTDKLLEELISSIELYDVLNYQREAVLDCVMYRIIERGGTRIGPRRGLLFAKEFGRSIDIPMMYGYDFSDPGLRIFVNEYIKAGGSLDLNCLQDYGRRNKPNEPLEIITVREILKEERNYTDEEKKLHQNLVNALANSIDQEKLEHEKIKQLRIERKLAKSKR